MKNESVQYAKAIGIVLVVIGHSGFWPCDNPFIYMFHMPLFFFLSGYCFKEDNLTKSYKPYIIKKVKGLYFPYIKWALFFLLIHNILCYIEIYDKEYGFYEYTFTETAKRFLSIVTCMSGEDAMLGGFWFLKYLFFSSIALFVLLKNIKIQFLIFVSLIIAMFLSSYFNKHIPYLGLGSTFFMAILFMWGGKMYKKQQVTMRWSFVIIGLLLVSIGAILWPCTMLNFTFSKSLLYLISGIAGSVMILGICQLWLSKIVDKRWKNIFLFVGDNTLTILALHFISFKIVSCFIVMFYGLKPYRLSEFITIHEYSRAGYWMLYSIVGVVVPLIFVKFKRKLYEIK